MAGTRACTFATAAIGAGMLLMLSAQFAAATPARVAANVNLRQGPGTTFGIIATIPGGNTVDVMGCQGEWCNVQWNGRGGYVIARNLNLGEGGPGPGPGPGPVAGPYPPDPYYGPPVVVEAPYYYGPRVYWGPRWGGRWRRW